MAKGWFAVAYVCTTQAQKLIAYQEHGKEQRDGAFLGSPAKRYHSQHTMEAQKNGHLELCAMKKVVADVVGANYGEANLTQVWPLLSPHLNPPAPFRLGASCLACKKEGLVYNTPKVSTIGRPCLIVVDSVCTPPPAPNLTSIAPSRGAYQKNLVFVTKIPPICANFYQKKNLHPFF